MLLTAVLPQHGTRSLPNTVQANLTPGLHRWRVLPYVWGQGDAAAALLPPALVPPPDLEAGGEQQPDESPPHGSPPHGGLAAPAASPLAQPADPRQAATAAAAAASSSGISSSGGVGSCRGSFDVITAADVVYQPEAYEALAATLRALAAPHTLVLLAYKRRGGWVVACCKGNVCLRWPLSLLCG